MRTPQTLTTLDVGRALLRSFAPADRRPVETTHLHGPNDWTRTYDRLMSRYGAYERTLFDLCTSTPAHEMMLPAYCAVCERDTDVIGNLEFYEDHGPEVSPVACWRESLACTSCWLSNRMRYFTARVRDQFAGGDVYILEQTSRSFRHLATRLSTLVGSEYLGPDLAPGTVVDGVRHEDATRLSFGDSSFDLVASQDVMEHVHEPWAALAEFHRVLRPGGRLLFTAPFWPDKAVSLQRAHVSDGEIHHLETPVFHRNPLSAQGSLVFTDFGWDTLSRLEEAGFAQARLEVYYSVEHANIGIMPFLFSAEKPR